MFARAARSRGFFLGAQWQGMLFIMVTVISIVIGWKLIGDDFTVYGRLRRGFFSGGGGSWGWNSGNGGNSMIGGEGAEGFNYKAVVSFQAKDREDPFYKELKGKFSATGEDNYFIRKVDSDNIYAGVADGVGGWAEHGYDSSAISRELCSAMSEFAIGLGAEPQKLIELGYNKIQKDGTVQVGGTTATVAHFTPEGKLNVANLGDSWCGVFRNDKLAFQTKFQTVGFNAPYQLAIVPEQMVKEAARRGSSYIRNQPADADEYSFQLQKGDIVFLATDGVTDNVATEDMELFLQDNHSLIESDLQKTSQDFVDKTVQLSKDPGFPSVFAQEISRLTGKRYTGGKEDDITLVVVKVE